MKKPDVIRAWRDEEYRDSLSAEEQAALPSNPAGIADVDDDALKSITGGCAPSTPGVSCVPPGTFCP